MNSQRGKASSNASRNQHPKKAGPNVQAKAQREKPQTQRPPRKRRNRGGKPNNLSNVQSSTGRLGMASGNRSGTTRHGQVIEEDEYIAEVSGSVAFATTAYSINPGQSGTFPWASKVAGLYEKYRFTSLEFYYRREVSEFATNGSAGKVMLSCDYDASDAAPTTKQQVEDTVPHADGMPCTERIILRVDCRQMARQDSFYVRPGAQPANTDIKTYDSGVLYVSTYGCTNTTVVGELRVKYRCELSVPVLLTVPSTAITGSTQYFSQSGIASGATTVAAAMFGGVTASSILGVGVVDGTIGFGKGQFTFPAGRYLVELSTLSVCSAANFTSASQTSISTGTTASGGSYSISGSAGHGFYGTVSGTLNQEIEYTFNSILWDTAVLGTVMTCWLTDTYSAGTVTNDAFLRITTL
jgi:hypothetical protein